MIGADKLMNRPSARGQRDRGRSLQIGLNLLLVGLQLFMLTSPAGPATVQAAVTINEPPVAREIIAFPARDFVSASGYSADDRVVVKVIHPGGTTRDPAAA